MSFKKWSSWKTGCILPGLLFVFIMVFSGCAAKKGRVEGLSPYYPGPQIAVEPIVARLGISTLLKTPIRIGGMGFDPGDTVFIDIVGGEGETVGIYGFRDSDAGEGLRKKLYYMQAILSKRRI